MIGLISVGMVRVYLSLENSISNDTGASMASFIPCETYSSEYVIVNSTIYWESFTKENFRDMSIVTVLYSKKTFANLEEEIIQENVCKCSKTCKISKYFLSQTIPDIWYMITITT